MYLLENNTKDQVHFMTFRIPIHLGLVLLAAIIKTNWACPNPWRIASAHNWAFSASIPPRVITVPRLKITNPA